MDIRSLNWRRLGRVAKVFAVSDVGRKAILLFGTLLILLLGVSILNVVSSYVGRDFMTAIAERDGHGFIWLAVAYIGVFAASTVVAVFFRYAEERLGLVWREWLTRWLVTAYLSDHTYYRLKEDGGIENPDERIAEDVRVFTATTLSFTLMILNGTITVVAFSGVIWSISPLLFAVTVAYAAIGSLLTLKLGRSLIGLNYTQLDKEASFRASLIHVWENTEAIALARHEHGLIRRLQARVDDVMGNFYRIIRVHRNLGFFTTGYNYLIQIIPALVVAPLFIRGEVDFGVIPQATMAFAHLVGAFSLIVTQFQSISSFAAVIARIGSLAEVIETGRRGKATGVRMVQAGEELTFENLSLFVPDDESRLLLSGLSLTLPHNSRVLLSGDGEAARQALFKAVAGLWRSGSGTIVRPKGNRTFFLPEHPYLPPGSLREALWGGKQSSPDTEPMILNTLKVLGLEPALARSGGLDSEGTWPVSLSLAEQQLFSFARGLLAKPRFVFIDRAWIALSPEQRHCVLDALSAHGITSIFQAGDPSLAEEGYDAVLSLRADGSWHWDPCQPATNEKPEADI